MPFCTECGHENPDTARFCSQCGHRIQQPTPHAEPAEESTANISFPQTTDAEEREAADLSPDDAAAVDALPPGSALLVVQRGPSAGSRFLLDTDEVSAGRHPDSDIFLDDVTVSRRHAAFRRTPEGYHVSDVGSLNGTYVNRDRIDDILLTGGDEVQIGKYRLVYFAGPQHAGGARR
ncbi:MAG: FHA domain-containing protein [Nocardioidaceae bacterium]